LKKQSRCRANTVGKVEMRINLLEAKRLQATGELIFTENGIRAPVVLDFAREITPLLK
jgi:predicted flavoprotein YhiN